MAFLGNQRLKVLRCRSMQYADTDNMPKSYEMPRRPPRRPPRHSKRWHRQW